MMDHALSVQALMWARRAAKAAGWVFPSTPSPSPASAGDATRLASAGDSSGTLAALAAGSDPMVRDADGINAIMWAAHRGDAASLSAMIDLVIAGRSDARTLDPSGTNALMRAAALGRAKCVAMLIPFSEPGAVDQSGWNALSMASAGGHAACVKLLASFDDPSAALAGGRTALMEAAAKGRSQCCEALCHACDPRAVDFSGATAADLALEAGHTAVVDLINAMVRIRDERDELGAFVEAEGKSSRGSSRL